MQEQLFAELGFSEKEVRVYLLLARAGKCTAQVLAKRGKLPRTTTYSVLESLSEKGLVSEEHTTGTTFFVVNKPTAILRSVEAQAAEVKRKEVAARELIEQISPLFKSKLFGVPRMLFFEGKAGVENMLYDHCEDWQMSILESDQTWWGVQAQDFSNHYSEWIKYYRARSNKLEKSQLLSLAPLSESNSKVPHHKFRQISKSELPQLVTGAGTIWVAGDFIIFLVTHEEPHYSFELRDRQLASLLKLPFQLIK